MKMKADDQKANGAVVLSRTRDHQYEFMKDADAALSLCALSIKSPSPPVGDSYEVAIVTPTPGSSPTAHNKTPAPHLRLLTGNCQGSEQKMVTSTTTTSRKNSMKPKDPRRDTCISFEEMKRLMRVYGPIKALRNRASKELGRAAKPESIRRKFYRWFPDFHERFAKTTVGWYAPKAGHEEEMRYREAMRKRDQELLVKKRNDKRYNFGFVGNLH
ncbi:hypothetical protein ACHAWF_011214 [Thalassiosira exigua]